MSTRRAFLHSCGGWYAATVDADGYHRQPTHCVLHGRGRCYATPAAALAAARARFDVPDDDDDVYDDDLEPC